MFKNENISWNFRKTIDVGEKWANGVSKPACLEQDVLFKDKLLMIPGPTNIDPRVLEALSTPIVAHTDPQCYRLMRQIQEGIRYVFQTQNKYTFTLTGSATSAMETAICNLLTSSQTFLSLVHGHWGNRAASMAERLNIRVYRLRIPRIGDVFDLRQIEDALEKHRPQLMYVCHGDSSLGTLQPLHGIGSLCHRYNCLLMVDAVVSLCTTPLMMDSLQIDVLFSGAQKALSGPPGVALISFSERAVETIKKRSKNIPTSSYYNDITLIAKAWGVDNNDTFAYHYTHAINLLFGLRAALSLVVKEGLENVVKRHTEAKAYFEQIILSNQITKLEFLIENPEYRLPGIMSVIIPDDIDGKQIISYLYKKYDILIGGSLLANLNAPKFWRIGYLGVNAKKDNIRIVCTALDEAIKHHRSLKARL